MDVMTKERLILPPSSNSYLTCEVYPFTEKGTDNAMGLLCLAPLHFSKIDVKSENLSYFFYPPHSEPFKLFITNLSNETLRIPKGVLIAKIAQVSSVDFGTVLYPIQRVN
jgi:hypothetical protein